MRKEQIITTNNNQMEEKGMKNRFIHFKKRFVPALSGTLMGVMLMSTTCFAAGMKIFRRGIFGRRLRDEVFYKAIRYMRAGKADALIVTNLDAISDGIADSYLKIGAVREAGFRLFSVDEKEPKVDLYIPPKRGDLQ